MDDENGIVEKLDRAITDKSTPEWAIGLLLAVRDDHTRLRTHLSWHAGVDVALKKVGLGIASLLATSFVVWLLSGGAAAIFK